ncbi:MAG: hypothetical protein ISS35_02925 [Kiritimatiellae bacterium]|nr:hypothetical protein [Kiritimatiellia bacterium]
MKQGALIGSVACFGIGILLMSISLWSFIIYSPLFLAAFVLSIVAMSQRRVAGGIIMMLLTLIVPPVLLLAIPSFKHARTHAVNSQEVSTPKPAAPPTTSKPRPSRKVSTPKPAAPPTVEKHVGWKIRTDISAIDDSKSYFLSRAAEEPIGSGIFSSTPTLMIRHKEGDLEVFIGFGTYLGSDSITVTHRMGSNPAQHEEWGLSTDGKSIFCPVDAVAFVGQLLVSNRLVVRLTPYGESPVTSTFDLSGLPEAIQPMRSLIR